MTRITEANVVRAIGRYLDTIGVEWIKTTGVGKSGTPDIIGCWLGQCFALEVKRPGGRATKLQLHRLQKWMKAGAKAGVVFGVDDVKNLLEIRG